MRDLRLVKLADLLVNYSVEVQKGEQVLIQLDEPEALPLAEELLKKILTKGAYPLIRIRPDIFSYLMVKYANKDQINNFLDSTIYELKNVQVRIRIVAPKNLRLMNSADPEKLSLLESKLGKSRNYLGKIKWVVFYYPTEALAQQMNMSLEEAEDFIFKICLKDWPAETKKMKKIKDLFDQGNRVTIKGDFTNISFNIKGRKGSIGNGKHNIPDGEVFYAPIEDSVNGFVSFEGLRIYENKELRDISLEFADGQVVNATAKEGEDFLKLLIKTDEGSDKIGEFGIGTNYDVTKITGEMLFDEKMGGTIHLALGISASPDGKNKSAIHLDLLKDLRQGGKIYLDDKLVQENGKFLF